MAPRWLFRVFDAMHVKGNGWVLLPGARRDAGVRAGDRVELRGGKGPTRIGTVKAVGMFAPKTDPAGNRDDDAVPLLVELEPTDRPLLIRAEVWLIR